MVATLSRHVKDEMATRIEEQRAKIRALELGLRSAGEIMRSASKNGLEKQSLDTMSKGAVQPCNPLRGAFDHRFCTLEILQKPCSGQSSRACQLFLLTAFNSAKNSS